MTKLFSLAMLVAMLGALSAHAETIYIGDDAVKGTAVTQPDNVADTASTPPGNITYAFSADAITNNSGIAQQWTATEVNFWGFEDGHTVTPYLALYNGAGTGAGANFNVISVGDPLTSTVGANNLAFTVDGANPTVTVNDGETLIAGFHQSGRAIPFGDGGDGDYLSANPNKIPGTLPNTLTGNPTWSNLGRTYAFNVGIEAAIPEPSSLALLLIAAIFSLSGMGLMRRRRRTRA